MQDREILNAGRAEIIAPTPRVLDNVTVSGHLLIRGSAELHGDTWYTSDMDGVTGIKRIDIFNTGGS